MIRAVRAYLRSIDPRLPRSVWTLEAGGLVNAFGNGIFDATGVRIREVPFTPDRIKAALAARVG